MKKPTYRQLTNFSIFWANANMLVRGDKFATEDEFNDIISDPWSYQDMWFEDAIKYFGLSDVRGIHPNHIKKTVKYITW